MNKAMPTETGTARTRASTLESRVPQASAAIPKTDGDESGNQTLVVQKLAVLAWSAGTARQNRKTAIPRMTSSRETLAAAAIPENTRSPRRTLRPPICGPPGSVGAPPKTAPESRSSTSFGSLMCAPRQVRPATHAAGRTNCASQGRCSAAWSGNLGDHGLDLGLDLLGQRRVAEIGQLCLPRVARGVAEEALDQGGL